MPPPAMPPPALPPPRSAFADASAAGLSAAADDLSQYGLLPRGASTDVAPLPLAGSGRHLSAYLSAEDVRRLSGGESSSTPSAEGDKVGADNIGHQMLQSMGWSEGHGLGANGEGLVDPVQGGRVDDGKAKAGVGLDGDSDDAFATYRRSLAKAYTHRNVLLNAGPQNNFMPGTVPPPKDSRR